VLSIGESYGGVYVPNIAYEILTGADATLKQALKGGMHSCATTLFSTSLLLRSSGIMIGNPVFSCQAWKQYGNTVQVELYYWHGM
jgi:carboxypeptidase C (cathepsin A)